MNDKLISRPTFKNRLEKKESIIETKFIAQIDPHPYNFRSNLYNLFSKIFFIPSAKTYSFPGRKEIKKKKNSLYRPFIRIRNGTLPRPLAHYHTDWTVVTTVSCRINIQPSSEARAKFSLCTIGPLGVHSFEWDRSVDLIGLLCNYFINEAEGEGGGAKPPEVVTGFGGEKRRKEKTEGRRADIYPAIDLLERVTRTPSIRALVSCLP